ncbi:uncharacterized protein (DUF2249 family) [Paenibacillus mucilaginosus]|uniref:DUF2249 domain-containing protein n=1 Tax=Paenibacillus mucilaginosus TaxID=61624 RepID=UPI003D24F09A
MSMQENVRQLDVRPQLHRKLDPFQLIMKTVRELGREEMLILHATLKPVPLFGLMKLKGFASRTEQVGERYWITAFLHKSQDQARLAGLQLNRWAVPHLEDEGSAVGTEEGTPAGREGEAGGAARDQAMAEDHGRADLDNRGLVPPQPMVRTLSALEHLAPGGTLTIHNDRTPVFLLEELHRLGYTYQSVTQADGSAIIWILKPAT